MLHTPSAFKQHQHGQAMVEYAILLILMVTLIMGGLELSVTAYHSKKTSDAAEAGANSWAEAIGFSKANPTDPNEQTTEEFEELLERERQALNIDTDTDIGESSITTTEQGRPSLNSSCIGDVGFSVEPTEFISLPIDITRCDPVVKSKSSYDPSTDPDSDANTLNGIRALILDLYPTAGGDYRALDPYYDFITVCTRNDATTGNVEKIVECKTNRNVDVFNTDTAPTDGIQDACTTPPGPCSDGLEDDDPTYRKLLVLKELKNTEEYNAATSASTPTQPTATGQPRRGLGDHNPANFLRPFCNPLGATATANDYNNGLPDTTSIYLFNPLPINITNCTGDDPFRQNRSRISILVGGYTNDANPALNIEGLPALNQAIYSQYTKVCVVENAGQITIATATGPTGGTTLVGLDRCSGNGRAIWLKPPGKMCGAAGGGEVCPDATGNPVDLNSATGYYFFGVGNTSGRGQFSWTNNNTNTLANIANTFRPTFQIVCGDLSNNAHQSGQVDTDGDCAASGNGSFALEVHTRYRSIFESFLTFGLQALSTSPINLANYFYNPTGVGADSTVLVGATGSELGAMTTFDHDNNPATPERLVPTVKQFKDFRGCYRVDISPSDKIGEQVKTAVSSCN